MTRAYIGMGSNIQRELHVRSGVEALNVRFGPVDVSRVFESEAVGFEGPSFYNLVVGFDTNLEVQPLATWLRELEKAHGRPPHTSKYSSRTLDLDILLYGDLVRHDEHLDIPRPDILHYAFVLWPLAEIAPELRHPETGEHIKDIWRRFDRSAQRLQPVAGLDLTTELHGQQSMGGRS